jgi:endoglucanase
MNQRQTNLLFTILSQPTAPFREDLVVDVVVHALRRYHVPYFFDPIGNIVVGVSSAKQYRELLRDRHGEPVRVLAAHMDHPGFHGVKWLPNNRLQVKWFGGSPVKHLNGARVWLADTNGALGHGRMRSPKLHKSKRYLLSAEIQFENKTLVKESTASDIFGGFAFRKAVWQSGKRLYTKAADDLVGVFAIIETAIAAFRNKTDRNEARMVPPFIGLLPRAEYVVFVGAIGHFEL